MQLNKGLKQGWKPITIAVGLIAGSAANLYADVDQFSQVNTVLNNYVTSKYLQEFDDMSEMAMNDRRKFYNYYTAWNEQTLFLSSVSAIVEHQAFQAIVAMGRRAVPFIIEEINAKPSMLVWALNFIYQRKITDNPQTTIAEACRLWVRELSK
jgi:hypothetical protein